MLRHWAACGMVLAAGLLLIAACGEPLSTPEPADLQAAGAMSMGPLVEALAHAYRERQPYVSLEVSGLEPYGGLGTAYGLRALRDGEIDLALASWLPPEGAGDDYPLGPALDSEYKATAIARDGIAIVVHPENPLEGLGLLQLRDLFSGRSDEWQSLGGQMPEGLIQPVSREVGSGARAAFEGLVMDGMAITPRALMAPSGKGVVHAVANDPLAIGYLSTTEVTPDVKVLKIEGESPSQEAVELVSYPLTRELWLVVASQSQSQVQEFVDFARSPAGQQVVADHTGRLR